MKIERHKLTFTRDEAFEHVLEGDVLLDEICDHRRWSVGHYVIFRYEGRLWRTNYSVGATESQDETPWQYDEEVVCHEVEEYEKTVKGYRRID